MNRMTNWLRPRVFLITLLAWTAFWLGEASVGLFGLIVDGVRQPVFSRWVLGAIAQQAVPFGVATPILLHLGARFAALPPQRRSWLRPVGWVLLCCLGHGSVWTMANWQSEGNWLPLALSVVQWGMPYGGITGVALALGHQRVAADRERELLAAQLRALRSQLQPHFLFNTLQAIAATARRDADATVRMTALLGDLLRQTLRERGEDLVTLAEERALLQPYLDLQRIRFGDRLTIETQFADDVLDAAVPDLLLQPLVENALCHGIEKLPGAGTVVVRARRDGDRLELQVADDGAGCGSAADDGVGLGGTRARLAALYGDRAELAMAPGGVRGTVVTLRLPFHRVARAA